MRIPEPLVRTGWRVLGGFLVLSCAYAVARPAAALQAQAPETLQCDPDNGGLTLAEGFCAVVVADGLDRIRRIDVAPNGDVFVSMALTGVPTSGIALRDTTGDGRADVSSRFGDIGGTGLTLGDRHLYFATTDRLRAHVRPWIPIYRRHSAMLLALVVLGVAGAWYGYRKSGNRGLLGLMAVAGVGGVVILSNLVVREVRQELQDRRPYRDAVVRYALAPDRLGPVGPPDTIVHDLPSAVLHGAKDLVLDGAQDIFVTIGSLTNACQEEQDMHAPGLDPCPDLEIRAGVWRFNRHRTFQTQADGEHYATGIRNMIALDRQPGTGQLYGVQHGMDGLQHWPDIYTPEEGARRPSEEMLRIDRGDDFGWPYCYHDPIMGRKLLAPMYGGDGTEVGRCAGKEDPVLAFPAHWAPMDIVFYDHTQFPEPYRGGAFVAFHGSSNRPPLPQEGYHVVFVPFEEDGTPSQEYDVFADGFAGAVMQPGAADHRPSGLAVGPEGSLYVSDDRGGRIWRILYRPDQAGAGAEPLSPPDPASPND